MKKFFAAGLALAGLALLAANTDANLDGGNYARWVSKVSARIDSAIAAQPANVDMPFRMGAVGLAFSVDADGRTSNIRIVQSSGDAVLDRRAMTKLRQAGRLKGAPAMAQQHPQFAVIRFGRPTTARDMALLEQRAALASNSVRGEAQRLAALETGRITLASTGR